MKYKRIAALALVGSLLGGSFLTVAPVASAESSVEKADVRIDGQSISEGGLVVDGRTFVSVRQLQDTLRAFLYWDAANKRLYLNKPNINLLLFRDKTPFGKVQAGNKIQFSVLAQVDSLKTDVDAIRLTLTDPNGKTTEIQESSLSTTEDNFWFRSNELQYEFENKGHYKIQCYLRQTGGEYTLLAEMKLEAVESLK